MKRIIHFFKQGVQYPFYFLFILISTFFLPNFSTAQQIELPIYVISKAEFSPLFLLPKGRSKITTCVRIESAEQLLMKGSSLQLFGFRKRHIGGKKEFTLKNIPALQSQVSPLKSILVTYQPYLIANCEIRISKLKKAIESKITLNSNYSIYFIPSIKPIDSNASIKTYQLLFEAYVLDDTLMSSEVKTFSQLINDRTLVGSFNPSPPSKPVDYKQ